MISKPKDYGMNTDLSMIWLPKLSNLAEDLSGLAKTTMEMSNQTLWPKVLDHWE